MKPVAAAAVVAIWGDSVLLVRRGQAPRVGSWSFPGGAIEPGETARQAAEREAFEETGLRVVTQDVVDVFDAIVPPCDGSVEFHYCVADYLGVIEDLDAEPRAGDDAADVCWAPLDSLGPFEITDAMRCVIRRAVWLKDRRRPAAIGSACDTYGPPRVGRAFGGALGGALYVITEEASPCRGHLDVARDALRGGARVIQLRDKTLDGGALLELGRRIGAMTRASGALFVVNDRVDVAKVCGSDGAHLGQTDLPVTATREILGPDACIGVSVESVEQARAAERDGASYLGVGDVFGTRSKSDAGTPVGLEHLQLIRAATSLPIVAIGGITAARVGDVRRAGADSVAVISAVSRSEDMVDAARTLANLCAVEVR